MTVPQNINKEHLLKAIEKIDVEGIPANAHSSTYDVVFNENRYPPKLVISWANIFANGNELDRNSFAGGLNTPCFDLLEREGFQIIRKEKSTMGELTKEQFIDAFENGSVFKKQGYKLLNVWSGYPGATITATQLAQELGYKDVAPINKLVGSLGNRIAEYLKVSSELDDEAKGCQILATGKQKEYFEWRMKNSLKDAFFEYQNSIQRMHELCKEFLKEWPKERLLNMGLEEYTGVGDVNTLTNWLEFRLNDIGSIRGGSSFKFGVYKRKSKDEKQDRGLYSFTEEYAWLKKYGDSEVEAFGEIRKLIHEIADAASKADYEKIDEIDYPDLVKWKIAFLYQNQENKGVVSIYSKAQLLDLTGYKKDTEYSEIYSKLIKDIFERDIFEYSQSLWSQANKKMVSYFPELESFLNQSKTNNLTHAQYKREHLGLRVKVSFGQGMAAQVPWIGFYREGQTTMNGIYPVYLLYKSMNCLILAKGRSETNPPRIDWPSHLHETINAYFSREYNHVPERYGDSYVFKAYDLNNPLNVDEVDKDLKELIEEYKKIPLEDYAPNVPIDINFKVDLTLPKPFLLLAGISGTGKTRFVREQANADRSNYAIVAVRPDWHEPSDLLGYVSRIGNHGAEYVVTDVLRFMVKAWQAAFAAFDGSSVSLKPLEQIEPYWLCLDEMNLAPVEQYFADYLSVLETREWKTGEYGCEPLLKLGALKEILKADGLERLRGHLGLEGDAGQPLWDFFLAKGIPLPPNLIVAGTVNMDETTHGFSRKVIDRAFTIDFGGFFPNDYAHYLEPDNAPQPVKFGFPVLSSVTPHDLQSVVADSDGKKSVAFLETVNKVLKGTPFELAYRALNELLLAVVCFSPKDEDELKAAWDDFLMTKVLPRIEGDDEKLRLNDRQEGSVLEELETLLKGLLPENRPDLFRTNTQADEPLMIPARSLAKLEWMRKRLKHNSFTAFWP